MNAAPRDTLRGAFGAFDERAMARALELATLGLETTHPNPRVGCVIARGAEIVGEGWHERPGGAHAEVVALRAAGDRARGGTAYVTLEPCNHHGRTPPCVDALLAARIERVVFAVTDPNPRVAGNGASRLRAAGVLTESGLMANEAEALNAGFFKRMRSGVPWVRLKQAASLDGRTALANGASRWISGEAARADVHHWRARSSAVLTGIGTVLADDPALTARPGRTVERQPLRVVLDSELRTPRQARLFAQEGATLVFCGPTPDGARVAALEAAGARVEQLARSSNGLDLAAVLTRLGALEVNELWVECGPGLAGAFLQSGLVDEWLIYVAPCVLGRDALPLVDFAAPPTMQDRADFDLEDVQRLGADLRLTLRPRRADR